MFSLYTICLLAYYCGMRYVLGDCGVGISSNTHALYAINLNSGASTELQAGFTNGGQASALDRSTSTVYGALSPTSVNLVTYDIATGAVGGPIILKCMDSGDLTCLPEENPSQGWHGLNYNCHNGYIYGNFENSANIYEIVIDLTANTGTIENYGQSHDDGGLAQYALLVSKDGIDVYVTDANTAGDERIFTNMLGADPDSFDVWFDGASLDKINTMDWYSVDDNNNKILGCSSPSTTETVCNLFEEGAAADSDAFTTTSFITGMEIMYGVSCDDVENRQVANSKNYASCPSGGGGGPTPGTPPACDLNWCWQLAGKKPVLDSNQITYSSETYRFWDLDTNDVHAVIAAVEEETEDDESRFEFCVTTKRLNRIDGDDVYNTANQELVRDDHRDWNIEAGYSHSFLDPHRHYTADRNVGTCGGLFDFDHEGGIDDTNANGWTITENSASSSSCAKVTMCKIISWDELRECKRDGDYVLSEKVVKNDDGYNDYAEICGKWYVSAIGYDTQFENDVVNVDLNLVYGIVDYPFCFKLDLNIHAITHVYVDLCKCWWIAAYKLHPDDLEESGKGEYGAFLRKQAVQLAYVCDIASFTKPDLIEIKVPTTPDGKRVTWETQVGDTITQTHPFLRKGYDPYECYKKAGYDYVCPFAGDIITLEGIFGNYDSDETGAKEACDQYYFSSNNDDDYQISITMKCNTGGSAEELNYCKKYLRKFYGYDEDDESAICQVNMPLYWEDEICIQHGEKVQFKIDLEIYYYGDDGEWYGVDYEESNCNSQTHDSCHFFKSGLDVVKVVININIPEAYYGEVISSKIQNIWICWFADIWHVPQLPSGFHSHDDADYGCFDPDTIGKLTLMSNTIQCPTNAAGTSCSSEDELQLVSVTTSGLWIIQSDGSNLQFGFRVPYTLDKTKIWIHAQVSYDYITRANTRRRLIKHHISSNNNNNNKNKNKKVLKDFKHNINSIITQNNNHANSPAAAKQTVLSKLEKNIFIRKKNKH